MAHFNPKKEYDLKDPDERVCLWRGKIIEGMITLEHIMQTAISVAYDNKVFGQLFDLLEMYEGISLQTKANILFDIAHLHCPDFLGNNPTFKSLIMELIQKRNKAAHYKTRWDYIERNGRRELVILLEMPTVKKETKGKKNKKFSGIKTTKTFELSDESVELFEQQIDKALNMLAELQNSLRKIPIEIRKNSLPSIYQIHQKG